ncbi:serine hydrolase domain-containing protein [Chitinophaga sp.]|uniref:serine hydrolase domain-containing protein n=1 Tax=Chitinophaga sp. TaxID=1869181 RepID=UPI0031D5112B
MRWYYSNRSIKLCSFVLVAAMLLLAACSKKDLPPTLPDARADTNEDLTLTVDMPVIDTQITNFMAEYNVPGASIAVTKNGKLVYAKGYGFADTSTLEAVDTASLFRIASLSKFVTAIGIMKLVEDDELELTDKVFGATGLLGDTLGTLPYPAYVGDITVEHLLRHEGGGWGNSSNDPAFAQSTLNIDQLIGWAIDNRPLATAPGTNTDYSNLGFMILGRIIEKVSGQAYVDFIQQNVLTPAGVTNMQIGASTLAGRKPNEVRYYGQSGQNPYGYASNTFSRLRAAGSWIASAIDLLRIMVHADGFTTVPDMLAPATITTMSTPSTISNYAFGIRISAVNHNWYHGGSLSGTRTWMVRTYHGYCWTILLNTRNTTAAFSTALDRLIWPAVNSSSTVWPNQDLF